MKGEVCRREVTIYSASRVRYGSQTVEAAYLEHELGTVESEAEEERGKDETHGARDYDACNAAGEATDAGFKLGWKVH